MATGTGLVFLVILFCFLVILTVFFIVVLVVAFVVLVVMAAAAIFHLPGDDVVMPTLDGGVGASASVDCSRVAADGVVTEMAGVVLEMVGVVVEMIAVVVPMAIGLLGMACAAVTCPLLVVVVTSPTVVG